MKKHCFITAVGFIVLSLITSCANMADDFEQEEIPKEQKRYSLSYVSEFGTAPKKQTMNNAYKLTEKELPALYADKKTFEGWTQSGTQEIINEKYKVTGDMVLTAKWRDIEKGDIVLAEGPIVSTDCYSIIKNSVHPMAIIYNTENGKNMGISVKSTNTFFCSDNTNRKFSTLRDAETGKDNYERIKKANSAIFSDKVFAALGYAEHYADLFSDTKECPYTKGWYIPSKKEMETAFLSLNVINKSFAKIEKGVKLLQTYSSYGGVWTSTSNGSQIIGISLVKSGNYTNMKNSLESTNKQQAERFFTNYTEKSVSVEKSDYKFYFLTMNCKKNLDAYCIKQF